MKIELTRQSYDDMREYAGQDIVGVVKDELRTNGIQQTIPEVDGLLLTAQMMEHAEPYDDWDSFVTISRGDWSEQGTLADEVFQLQHQQSRLVDRVSHGLEIYGGLEDYSKLIFDYYDCSIEIRDVPAGWTPNINVRQFLEYCGFGLIWVTYKDGAEKDRSWSTIA